MANTITGEHQIAQIIITPVIMLEDEHGRAVPVPDPEQDERTQYGCMVCNMGLEEAKEMPCPGLDMTEGFDDA